MIKLFPPKFWYRRNIISYILLPFSFVYRMFISLRRSYYKYFSSAKFSVPIVVVGNITVGGAGKTPLVIYLIEILKDHGYRPGVISRGYGRKIKIDSIDVTSESKVEEVGDEALLILRHAKCPIVIGSDRLIAAKKLLEVYNCNVIISDDGLQHYALPRYIEIAVVDAQIEFGNGFCLPAGPLREPISRLRQVGFIVKNFNTDLPSDRSKYCGSRRPSLETQRGKLQPALSDSVEHSMVLESTGFHNLKNSAYVKTAEGFKGQVIHAVAGIGNPKKFFQILRQLGLTIIEHPFPDHHMFRLDDFPFKNEIVIMTEKDAVKCDTIANENFWYMEAKAKPSDKFVDVLLKRLKEFHGF